MPQILARTPLALPSDSLLATQHMSEAVRPEEQRCFATAEQNEMDFFTDDYTAAMAESPPCFADCDVFLPRTGSDEFLCVRIPFAIPLAPQHTDRSSVRLPDEEKKEDEDEEAAAAAVSPTDFSDAALPPTALPAARAEKDIQTEPESGSGAKRYQLHLPRGFPLTHRLPRALEDALRHAAAHPATPAPPLWLSACVRHRSGGATAANDAMALEAITAAALELVARMGALRHTGAAHACNSGSYSNLSVKANVDSSESHAVATVQRALLWGDESLFGFGQADRVAQRLRCDAFLFAPESSSWPSLTAVVFYFAQEIARSLFPALSAGVEAAILTALQPLLEVDPPSPAHAQGLLCTDAQQRDALLLLTQGLAQWWWWWRPHTVEHSNNYSNKSPASNSDTMSCTLALSAPMSYAAVRALQQFAIVPVSLEPSTEDGETALFLLASPSLFAALLLDRDVTGVLDRAIKTMQAMTPTALSPSFSLQLARCITVLLCWMTFRPAGYESSLARAYFGTLLRLAAPPLAVHSVKDSIEERASVEEQMAQCGRQCCMRTGAMLRRLRGQCGKSSDVDKRRVNPWRQLRRGENIPKTRDEDECTAQSYRSLLDGSEGTEQAQDGLHSVLPLPFPLSPQGVPEAPRTLRHAVREVRVALRRLERDAFGESGVKRCRDGERAPHPAGISPQLAYHIYARPDGAQWEWHMYEDGDEEGEADTTTSSNRSASSGE